MNHVTRLSGSGFLARAAGSSAMRPVFLATQLALTGHRAHSGLRAQTVAPRSISACV